MAYNSLLKEYLDDLSKEGITVPQRWVVLAQKYNDGEFQLPDGDFGEIILKIAGFLKPQVEEQKPKKKKKTEAKVFEPPKEEVEIPEIEISEEKEEPKYRQNWEDEVEGEEDFNARIHAKVADEDVKSEDEE